MKKRRQFDKRIRLERRAKQIREMVRLRKVLDGLGDNLTLTEIHRKTGLSQKNIRKIMKNNPAEITFKMLTRTIPNNTKITG